MKIAGVRFPDNWRIYDFDATDIPVSVGDNVIVESDRGLGFARVVRIREGSSLPQPRPPRDRDQRGQNGQSARKDNGQELEEEIEIEVETPGSAAKPQPPAKGSRMVLRKANDEDLCKAEKNRAREAEAFKICQDLIVERELAMRPIRAEYSFDASRVTFYFFSENRIDFRDLVKDLAHKLRSRIEMRQVGVRDVARMIGGFGPCGRELCCTSHLRGFEPVSIRMAKKQEMVLNPAKISGVCGRLLCCLSYEYAMYDEIKKDVAEMKASAVKEKQEEKDRQLAEERREAEERKLAEDQRRKDDERRRQEQKREKQKAGAQRESGKQEKRREGTPDQQAQKTPDQKQDQRQRERQKQRQQQKQPQKQQQRPQQKPPQQQAQKQELRPEQAGGPEQQPQDGAPEGAQAQGAQAAEKTGGRSRRRRFWKKKKGKGDGQQGGGQPGGGGAPQPPAAGQ